MLLEQEEGGVLAGNTAQMSNVEKQEEEVEDRGGEAKRGEDEASRETRNGVARGWQRSLECMVEQAVLWIAWSGSGRRAAGWTGLAGLW